MNTDMDTRQLIIDTASKMFADTCDKPLLDAAEQGVFAQQIWATIVANGFHQLGSEASGTTPADMYAFLQCAGRYAVPLPLAETLLANLWLDASDQVASVGYVDQARVYDLPWGRQASRVVGISFDSNDIVLVDPLEVEAGRRSMAGEPLDVCAASGQTRTLAVSPLAQITLAYVNLMAGCLQTVLELGIQFATEREQFGRPISKFQAIQHSLAVVAAEVAAAKRCADAAVDALGDARFEQEVAAAKSRVGEAAGIVAEQVHQIHGAMGFTHEHRLHHYTRRVWSWRDRWGNEFYWQQRLGRHLSGLGADAVWDFIATPQ